ncbi:MAG: polysaccharide pyruvyl transferase family protein [Nocardioides sp.]|uniref:polysaccharide pyruvyl transferase family protein n=1 Tax=Nocardioides sp. TaxID=35761 RepID=UPI002395E479|nr:polysaccharide pyruvyl transferase family protein [Nocardioides sp.]MDE0776516.1 polysaccharide pyruvyl transferase family protein [Nocardioides sp.]
MIGHRHLYASAVAQHDNLGDLILRKVGIDWLRSTGHDLHVLAEGMPEGFVDALCLSPADHVHWSKRSWLLHMARHARAEGVGLLLSAGPQLLADNPRRLANHALTLGVATAVARRGATAKVGTAITGSGERAASLESAIARTAAVFSVRDQQTVDVLGLDQSAVFPDVAFAESFVRFYSGSLTPHEDRSIAALSFREDEAGKVESALPRIVAWCTAQRLRPVLVVQVQRDDAFARRMGASLGVEVVGWASGAAHGAQLTKVCEAYAQARVVVTNRLHAAIFGMVHEALPFALEDDKRKVARTLAPLGLEDVTWTAECSVSEAAERLLRERLILARARLEELRVALHRAMMLGPESS